MPPSTRGPGSRPGTKPAARKASRRSGRAVIRWTGTSQFAPSPLTAARGW